MSRNLAGARSVFVVNPNASDDVTRSITAALRSLDTDGLPLRCVTLHDGPPAIESHGDFERAIPCVARFVREHDDQAAAFVVACFSDPGLHEARSITASPVVGIQEASVEHALALGERFGIVALVDASVERQHRSLAATAALSRLAASRPVGLGLRELEDRTVAWPRIREVAARLRDEDGADSVILGCASMALYQADLEDALGVPVIDPCRAGVAAARARLARRSLNGAPPAAPRS